MNLDLLLLAGVYFFVASFAISFLLQRYRWRRRKRVGNNDCGYFPGAGSLGNALQVLNAFAQPQVRHVLREEQSEDEHDDEAGGLEDPSAHLLKQANKLRRGKLQEPLTALWKPPQ